MVTPVFDAPVTVAGVLLMRTWLLSLIVLNPVPVIRTSVPMAPLSGVNERMVSESLFSISVESLPVPVESCPAVIANVLLTSFWQLVYIQKRSTATVIRKIVFITFSKPHAQVRH